MSESTEIDKFIITLDLMKSDLEKALDGQIEVEKFISVLVFYLKKNLGLMDYDRQSLVNSIRDAASEGILIDGREGYLSPFKKVIKFGAMTAGIVKKLAIAGVSINPQIVRKNDKFEYWTDEKGQHIKHMPDPFASVEDRGPVIGAYSIAKTRDGFKHIEIMSKDEIEKVRSKSNNKEGLMWTEFYDEGAKKSVIRRGYKWLPKNPKLDDFFKKDDEDNFEFDNQPPSGEAKPARTTSRVEEIVSKSETVVPAVEPKAEEPPYSPTGPRLAKESPELKTVEGIIVKVGILGEKNKRYCCKINDVTYGTNLKAMYDEAIVPLFEQKANIKLSFVELAGTNGDFNDIIKIDDLTTKESKPPKKELPL